MSRVLQASTTQRGKPSLVDINNFSYTTHGSTASTQYWRCAQRKCGATLTTRKSTGNLVGENLPSHNHGNKLMRKVACITEKAVVSKYAEVHGATPTAVMQEISTNMLRTTFPGQVSSASSTGAIKMALWRKRQTLDPRPKIPSDHAEFMSTAVPDKYSQTGDGGNLIIFRDWTDDDKTQSMVICLSGFGADILRNHPVWLCDGTFKSTPDPFKQVKSNFLVFIVLIRIKNCSKSEYTSVQGLHYPGKT